MADLHVVNPSGASAFSGPDAPREDDLYSCIHCGFCLSVCPTYLETGLETESPRGRIFLMRAVHEGRIGITGEVASHWDLCLQCRACEVACPSGVPYGRMMEHTRTQVRRQRPGGPFARFLKWFVYRQLFPHQGRLEMGARLLRLYQRSGVQWLARQTRVLALIPPLRQAEAMMPSISSRVFRADGRVYPAQGERKHRVALLSGCVMPLVQASTMEASVRVLTRNGCDAAVPEGQGCCGALNTHGGDRETARAMARRNIDAFLEAGVEAVVVASAGCGSTMKEYEELLRDDPVYAGRAREFSGMVRDITEFLAALPLTAPERPLPVKVTYQDSCHLAHAQRQTVSPRTLLQSIPGLQFEEMPHADRCCGAAGTYQLTQQAMSRQLREHKMEDAATTGADVIATANPGCMLQLELGVREAGMQARVCHVVDLLDEAYGGQR
ncbi:MAG: heterodisulfide reductase-related iron-sulfur binding cluster, partial [Dehalococcoidia bacterium]